MSLNFGQGLFPSRREFIPSYDYADIKNGTGYDIYYGAKGDNGEYIVTTRAGIYSEEIVTGIKDQSVATSFTKYFDLDFDILFNLPQSIKGDILANIPMGMAATDASSQGFQFYVIVKAYHVDTTPTETLLGTGTSVTSIIAGLETDVVSFASRTHLLKANVAASTHFKKGETLRLTVEGWFKTTEAGAVAAHLLIGHDPANRAFNALIPNQPIYLAGSGAEELRLANEPQSGGTVNDLPTKMEFHVPFVLNI